MSFPADGLGLLSGGGSMSVLVPDAWEVSLTVQELIPESQNYMFESIMRDGLVTIDTRDQANVSKQGSAVGGQIASGLLPGVSNP